MQKNQQTEISLIVNDEPFVYHGPSSSLADFLKDVVQGRKIGVLVNSQVIAQAQYADFILKAGDRVDLIEFAGGG